MKLKKNLLGAILGVCSVVSCLGGALLLNESVDVNAESQTSNLIYNFAADSFSLGGNNGTKLVSKGSIENIADGDTDTGSTDAYAELRINNGELIAGKNVSLTVDLGAVYNLKHFYMYSLQRFANVGLIYDLSVSTDGENFTVVADNIDEVSSKDVSCTNIERGTCTASIDIDGVGRYFKLDYVGISGDNANDWMINIYEMELYGYSLSSQGYQVNSATKKVGVEEGVTVGSLLSDLSIAGNATVQYCNANGEAVTDTTALAAEGDVIKVTDNMKSANMEAVSGCYDAANVSFVDEYTVTFGNIEEIPSGDGSQINTERNIYLDKNASDVVLPLSLGENEVATVKVNGAVKEVSAEKGSENLTLKALTGQLKYGENIVEITDSANNTVKFIVYKNVAQGEIAYYDFDVNTWTKNGENIVSNEIVDNGIDGKSMHSQKSSNNGTLFGFYPANNENGFAEFVWKTNTEYILTFDIKVLSGTSTDWWCPIRFGETGDVGYIYDDYSWKVAGSNKLFSQVTVTPNEDGSYRFTAIFKTLADGSNTSLDIPNWGGACNIYVDNICIKPVNPDAVRIACVGDSITEASNTDYSYPEQLQNILGYENYFVFNFGKSASNVLETGVYPYRTHAATQYNHLKTWNPDIVVMQLGTNDGRWDSGVETYGEQAFIDDYLSLLNEFKGLANKVYINISPYAFGNEYNIHADEVNNVITAIQGYIAYENDIDVIDVHSAVKACDRATYFPDYIHGNDAGYGVIAQTVADGLNGATFVNKYHLAYALYACRDTTSSAYTQAKAVYDEATATQEAVDAAYESIKDMIVISAKADTTPISQDKEVATNINSESGNGIENINDADSTNRWSSLAGRESVDGVYTEGPVDVMLDLGEEYAIYSIYIKWRSSDRIFYYNVAVSLDGGEYGEAFISFDQTMDDQFKQEMEYSVSGVSGRYVRLRITGMKSSNYIGIYELRVYGYKLTETEDFKVDNVERTIMMINENVEIASFEQAINIKGNAIGQVVKGAGNTASTVEQGDIYRISTVFGTIDYAIGMAENVQFKYAEGQEATIKVLHNSYITTVPFSGKPGKILHWYIEGTNTEWNFETDKVVSNLVLTAVWENITYTITYEGFGGSHTNVETYTVDDEITLTEATKPFSTFVGWYTDYDKMTGEFSGEIDTISIGTIGDLKLYAKFEEIAYDVIYHDTKEAANNNLTSVKASTDSTLVEISADNFIFEGWYLDSEFTERIDAITGELLSKLVDGKLNVYAKWTAIYKISFNVNGGEPIADMEYTSKSESVILPTLKRAHYTFGGWYEDSAFTQKVESISVNAGKDYELHAQWIPDTYTVSFYANGGTTVSDQTVAYNSKAVKPSDPVQEGYTFGGWYLDVACTQAYDFDNAVTDNVCLYAKWTESVPTENNSGCSGTIATLPICGLLVVALGCLLVKSKRKTNDI